MTKKIKEKLNELFVVFDIKENSYLVIEKKEVLNFMRKKCKVIIN